MKNLLNLLLIFMLLHNPLVSQEIDWQRTYGGPDVDWATSIEQTSDSGYIIGGTSIEEGGDVSCSGATDWWTSWIIKLSEIGNLQWDNCFADASFRRVNSIVETDDQGYILCGISMELDFRFVKIDANQDILWETTLGGEGFDMAYEIVKADDGGFFVIGESESEDIDDINNNGSRDYLVVKIDQDGEVIWKENFGGSKNDKGLSIQTTSDEGLILAGTTRSDDFDVSNNFGGTDSWVVKLSENGTLEWERSYGDSGSDLARSIFVTKDSGYILAGEKDFNAWVFKLTQEGDLEWEKSYGGSERDYVNTIKQTKDGGYVFVGTTSSIDGDLEPTDKLVQNLWFVKLNGNGDIENSMVLGGSDIDRGIDVIQIASDEYIVLGGTASSDGDLEFNNGEEDYWVIKLSQVTVSNSYISNVDNRLKVFPNPSLGNVTISLEELTSPTTLTLSQITGNVVLSKQVHEQDIILEGLNNGVYIITISCDAYTATKKVVVN